MPRLWCRCRVLRLRKPYWGQIKLPGEKELPSYHSPPRQCNFLAGNGQIRTADLSLSRSRPDHPYDLLSGRTLILRPNFLVGTGRFELPTCRLGGDRSIHLSYVPALQGAIVLIVAGPHALSPFGRCRAGSASRRSESFRLRRRRWRQPQRDRDRMRSHPARGLPQFRAPSDLAWFRPGTLVCPQFSIPVMRSPVRTCPG